MEGLEGGLEVAIEALGVKAVIAQEFAVGIAGFDSFFDGQGFEVGDAGETPMDFGKSVDERVLGGSVGLVVFFEAVEEGVELFLAFTREQEQFGKESVLDGVLGRALFTLDRKST